jgi:hypothetical protein
MEGQKIVDTSLLHFCNFQPPYPQITNRVETAQVFTRCGSLRIVGGAWQNHHQYKLEAQLKGME